MASMSATDAATDAAVEQAKRFRDASDKIRERSDATAKGLAALATTGLTAVGLTKFSDVFPTPPGQAPWVIVVLVSFVALAVPLFAFTLWLWDANRPLVPRSDLEQMATRGDIDDDEKTEMKRVYVETALRNNAVDLRAFEARGERFQRLADRSVDAAQVTRLSERARRIRAEVDVALTRAQLVVVRRRMNRALKGAPALLSAAVFVAALIGFGIATDHIDSERTERITVYRSCADAVEANVDANTLPDICDGAVATPDPPTEQQKHAAAVTAFATLFKTCVDTAAEQNDDLAMCDQIKARLLTAIGG
jgi:hypothetical protein